jgi:IclR family KDG regulon transcriptional repressor
VDRVEKVTAILKYISLHKEPCRVTDISKQLKITKSSTSRILSSLAKLQWVTQLDSEAYTVGDHMIEFSLSALADMEIRTASQPYLTELNDITKETVGLVLRIGMDDIVVDQKIGKNSVRHVLTMGSRHPLGIGGTGKVILAYMEKKEIEEVLNNLFKSGPLVSASGASIDIESLRKELVEIKKNGYAISIGERTAVTAAIAAPIFERNKVTGSIVITGPLPRFDRKLALQYSSLLVNTAKKISLRLGSQL